MNAPFKRQGRGGFLFVLSHFPVYYTAFYFYSRAFFATTSFLFCRPVTLNIRPRRTRTPHGYFIRRAWPIVVPATRDTTRSNTGPTVGRGGTMRKGLVFARNTFRDQHTASPQSGVAACILTYAVVLSCARLSTLHINKRFPRVWSLRVCVRFAFGRRVKNERLMNRVTHMPIFARYLGAKQLVRMCGRLRADKVFSVSLYFFFTSFPYPSNIVFPRLNVPAPATTSGHPRDTISQYEPRKTCSESEVSHVCGKTRPTY